MWLITNTILISKRITRAEISAASCACYIKPILPEGAWYGIAHSPPFTGELYYTVTNLWGTPHMWLL